MRIAFCGIGGTGKTTIAKMVEERMALKLVPSVSRPIMAKMGILEKDFPNLPVETAWEFQQQVHQQYAEGINKYRSGVWDRSPMDPLTYSVLRCHSVLTQDDLAQLIHWGRLVSQAFDHIFWCQPHEDQLKDLEDGLRDTAAGTRFLTTQIMYQFYGEMYMVPRDPYNTHMLPWEPVEARFKRICAVVYADRMDEVNKLNG